MKIAAVNSNYNISKVSQNANIQSAKNNIAFKGDEKADSFDKTASTQNVKKAASTGKKWGVGIASFFLTGLGQAINGQWGKAAGFFFGAVAIGALVGPVAPALAIMIGAGMSILSIVDAVKNAKSN